MTKREIIQAWKDPKFRGAIATPAGERADEAELKNVSGAVGCGYVCSASADCWGFRCDFWNL